MLPLKEYFSLLPYLSLLLIANFVVLPRSASWLGSNTSQRVSQDRPEHPFLTPITSDPLLTMACEVAGTAFVIAWWSTRIRRWWFPPVRDAQVGESELLARQSRDQVQFKRLGHSVLATAGGAIIYMLLILLLGAPLDGYLLQTYAFSLHLAVLTIWPAVYTLGIPSLHSAGTFDRYRLTRLYCEFSPQSPLERTLVYPVIGTLIGAWMGILPLCLDWDRPWQTYPLTPTFASIVGYIVGGYVSWGTSAYKSLRDDVHRERINAL